MTDPTKSLVIARHDAQNADGHWFAFARGQAAALCCAVFSHDPGYQASSRLAEVFFGTLSDLAGGVAHGEAFKSVIEGAANAALEHIQNVEDKGSGSLTFTVLTGCGASWLVASIGANLVFRLEGGIPALVIKPDSLLQKLRDRGLPAREFAAGIPTAVVAPSVPYRDSLHLTSVDLTPGEWLLGTRESAAFFDLRLGEQPASTAELERGVIDVLGRPYVRFPRTWIGVMAPRRSEAA